MRRIDRQQAFSARIVPERELRLSSTAESTQCERLGLQLFRPMRRHRYLRLQGTAREMKLARACRHSVDVTTNDFSQEHDSMGTILLIILILLLIGAVPAWPHSRGWGYGPSGLLGVVLIVLIVLLLMGRI